MSSFEWIVVGELGALLLIGVLCWSRLDQIHDRLVEKQLDELDDDQTQDELFAADAAAQRVARFRAERAAQAARDGSIHR